MSTLKKRRKQQTPNEELHSLGNRRSKVLKTGRKERRVGRGGGEKAEWKANGRKTHATPIGTKSEQTLFAHTKRVNSAVKRSAEERQAALFTHFMPKPLFSLRFVDVYQPSNHVGHGRGQSKRKTPKKEEKRTVVPLISSTSQRSLQDAWRESRSRVPRSPPHSDSVQRHPLR